MTLYKDCLKRGHDPLKVFRDRCDLETLQSYKEFQSIIKIETALELLTFKVEFYNKEDDADKFDLVLEFINEIQQDRFHEIEFMLNGEKTNANK